jgi:hypothetical protein
LERPYVYIAGITQNIHRILSSSDSVIYPNTSVITPLVIVTFKNYGRTPARIKSAGANLYLSGAQNHLPINVGFKEALGQGDTFNFICSSGLNLQPPICAQIKNNTFSIFLKFEVEYEDIFCNTHVTSGSLCYFVHLSDFGPSIPSVYYNKLT